MASFSTGESAPTPDALRLGRLDRLLDQLGEHQLTIRQQDLDVAGQLASLHAAVDKLERQANARSREQEDARVQHDLRIQTIEQRLLAADAGLLSLEERIEAAMAQQAAEVEELRHMTRTMLSQVVDRIADQFDALQVSLEEVVAGRRQDQADALQTAQAIASSLEEMQSWTQSQAQALKSELADELSKERDAAAAQFVQFTAAIDAIGERQATQTAHTATLLGTVQEQSTRLTGLEDAIQAADEREASASQLMQEALTLWQQGVEGQLGDVAGSLEEYKAYVGRLRKEVRALDEERAGTHAALVDALSRELNGLGGGMATLQRDAAGLLFELHHGGRTEET